MSNIYFYKYSIEINNLKISKAIIEITKIIIKNNLNTIKLILDTNLISNSIMYKTWNNKDNRLMAIEIINFLSEIKLVDNNEIILLKSLSHHECIHEEIKSNLRNILK